MSDPWLEVVGIGEDGMAGLSPAAREIVERAEIIVGGDRHHRLSDSATAKRVAWPSPFNAMIDTIRSYRGRRIVILVTGDPLWYSVGARLLRAIPASEIRFHPQLSAFQWAACRMGWSLADIETRTVHGRPVEQVIPSFAPGNRILVLTRDADTPRQVAALLTERGYGDSVLTVLSALGGPSEERFESTARDFSIRVPDFHVLAVQCIAGQEASHYPLTGLPDHAYDHDGKLTKQSARALALAKLIPSPDGILWDIGAGCGSISIEWMRAAREARAFAIEPRADRRALAESNARKLGTPALHLMDGHAPDALRGLPQPDAIFLGGGISLENGELAIHSVRPLGRVVAHAVTLESEAVLGELYRRHGGELIRIAAQTLEPIGKLHGWKPAMPVTQWSFRKEFSS